MSIKSLANDFCNGIYDHKVKDECWAPVFGWILNNKEKISIDKNKVHDIWSVNGGHLRRKIKNDKLIAQVLNLTLPGCFGNDLALYREECEFLHKQGLIGFCWTPDISVAEKFASGLNSIEGAGVLLKTTAPSTEDIPEKKYSQLELILYIFNTFYRTLWWRNTILTNVVGMEGFEPSKAEPAGLQSACVDRLHTYP